MKSPRKGYYVYCQVCSFKLHSSQAKLRWDNLLVCEKDWERRHPLDTPKIPRAEKLPRRVAPPGEERDLTDVYPNGVSASDL